MHRFHQRGFVRRRQCAGTEQQRDDDPQRQRCRHGMRVEYRLPDQQRDVTPDLARDLRDEIVHDAAREVMMNHSPAPLMLKAAHGDRTGADHGAKLVNQTAFVDRRLLALEDGFCQRGVGHQIDRGGSEPQPRQRLGRRMAVLGKQSEWVTPKGAYIRKQMRHR
jgi:hypothetical protein